jgi:uncharacterized protein YbjQ (UPF0145 family)
MQTGDGAEEKARRYRERAAKIRDAAGSEVRPYRRKQRQAYADALDRLAAQLEARSGGDPPTTPVT